MLNPLVFSEHAVYRMALRGITKQDVDYICKYGRKHIAAGVIHYFLMNKGIPIEDLGRKHAERLSGATVLIDSNDKRTVITVYRNPKSWKKDRRKLKFNLHRK